MDITFHFPPDLLNLMVDVIPKLSKSKQDLLTFFQGAGIDRSVLLTYVKLLQNNREGFNKYVVTREILVKLNQRGEPALGERRSLLQRVVEFQDYSVCWEKDQAPARGIVAQIRDLVKAKDTITKINQEREHERNERLKAERFQTQQIIRRNDERELIKKDFFSLFSESNPQKRGKLLESVLNRYFNYSKIQFSESITVKSISGEGITEQIDGIVVLRNQLFLVEMKWEKETLGKDKAGPHFVRVFSRNLAGGIIISYSDFSPGVISDCREALSQKTIVLCKLEELVRAIETEKELSDLFVEKIDAAVIHRNPFYVQ